MGFAPGRFVMRTLALGMIAFGVGTVHSMIQPIDVPRILKEDPAKETDADPVPDTGSSTDLDAKGTGDARTQAPRNDPKGGDEPIAADNGAADPDGQPKPVVVDPPEPTIPPPGDIGVEDAWLLFNTGAFFVDARASDEFAGGHVQGALSMPISALGSIRVIENLELLQSFSGTPIVIYCKGPDCSDSHDLKDRLESRGVTHLYVFTGGYPAWVEAGHPTETGPG